MAIASNIALALDTAAKEFGVDAALLRALAWVESGFNPLAKSKDGAMGLTQLMPETARELGVGDPFDPIQNARGGAKYLKRLLLRYHGDVGSALAAYNMGMGNLAKLGGAAWPEYIQNYVAKIIERRGLEAKALGLPPPLPPAAAPLALPLHSLRCSHCGSVYDAASLLRVVGSMLVDGAGELELRGSIGEAARNGSKL